MSDKYGIFRTVPVWDIKDEDYFREKMREMFEKASRMCMEHEFYIREIEEMDLGLDNWDLPPDQQNNWSGTNWVNHLLTQHESIMIYGASSPEGTLPIRKLIFKKAAGNMIIGRNDLSELKTLEPALKAIGECKDQEWLKETFDGSIYNVRMAGYFQEPYIYRPHESLSIGVIYLPGMAPGPLKLMGYVAETVGKSIA